jgi:hypothetical protein
MFACQRPRTRPPSLADDRQVTREHCGDCTPTSPGLSESNSLRGDGATGEVEPLRGLATSSL